MCKCATAWESVYSILIDSPHIGQLKNKATGSLAPPAHRQQYHSPEEDDSLDFRLGLDSFPAVSYSQPCRTGFAVKLG